MILHVIDAAAIIYNNMYNIRNGLFVIRRSLFQKYQTIFEDI